MQNICLLRLKEISRNPQSSNVKRTEEKCSEDYLVFVPTNPGFPSKQRDLPNDSGTINGEI